MAIGFGEPNHPVKMEISWISTKTERGRDREKKKICRYSSLHEMTLQVNAIGGYYVLHLKSYEIIVEGKIKICLYKIKLSSITNISTYYILLL